MDSYVIFKHVHMTAVALSGLLFMVRGLWLLQGSTQLQAKWVKITPHVIDTLLLVSAIAMLVVSQQFPAWVHVKITLLIVYIGLGLMAFKKAKTQGQKLTFLLAAVAVYVFLISVALTKSPAGFFA
ncbi:MAG TPA: SirB2 family protein [Agitococcus sp.]|nr:SirB2 family protein [Agitococcus sp.]HMV60726.1 SirB2 family protein [Agitococcus sp.]HMX98716.1 SirB2 family protein [Agitococcus sp.]HMY27700.1 SirB2 family protein [Agitococcus sp.]HNG09982.1 SirB2 family protein [Agitococcus sp.]